MQNVQGDRKREREKRKDGAIFSKSLQGKREEEKEKGKEIKKEYQVDLGPSPNL